MRYTSIVVYRFLQGTLATVTETRNQGLDSEAQGFLGELQRSLGELEEAMRGFLENNQELPAIRCEETSMELIKIIDVCAWCMHNRIILN